ncbi:MAG: WD40 repeat domain-containing protein [Myxococcota bacterium]
MKKQVKGFVQQKMLIGVALCALGTSNAMAMNLEDDEQAKGTRTEQLVLKGHTATVTSVSFLAGGTQVVSGGNDKSVSVWDVGSGFEIKRFEDYDAGITSVSFSADGKRIATSDSGLVITVWDADNWKKIARLQGHTSGVKSVSISADGKQVASGGYDRIVRLWDVDSGKEIKRFEGHTSYIESVAISPDGAYIVSGAMDKKVFIWNVASGKKKCFEGHTGYVKGVDISADGQYVVSGGYDNTVRVWHVETGVEFKRFTEHDEWVNDVAISADGKRVASGSQDNTVRVWDVEAGLEIKRFQGHSTYITSVSMSADGNWVASSSCDQTVRVWDVADQAHFTPATTSSLPAFFPQHGNKRWSDEKDMKDDGVDAGNKEDRQPTIASRLLKHDATARAVRFTANDQLVSSGLDRSIHLWNTETRREIQRMPGHDNPIFDISLSTNKRFAVTSSSDETVGVWDLQSKQQVKKLRGHALHWVRSADINKEMLISSGDDGKVLLWKQGVDQPQKMLHNDADNPVRKVRISHKGNFAVAAGDDHKVRVWDLPYGKLRHTFDHENIVRSVDVSPDCSYIASCGDGGEVRIWSYSTGEQLAVLKKHTGIVQDVRFAPVGNTQWLVSAGSDKIVRVWRMQQMSPTQWDQVAELKGPKKDIFGVDVSPDGQQVAAAGQGGVYMWNVGVLQLAAKEQKSSQSLPEQNTSVTENTHPRLLNITNDFQPKVNMDLDNEDSDLQLAIAKSLQQQ